VTGYEPAARYRSDEEPAGYDIEAAIRHALGQPGLAAARQALLSDAAVAAANVLDRIGTGTHPVDFLDYCVRMMGLARAAALAEPLPGEAARPAADWLAAGAEAGAGVAGDALFADWLHRVRVLMQVKRTAAGRAAAAVSTAGAAPTERAGTGEIAQILGGAAQRPTGPNGGGGE
jgi:hypothetical protein